MIRGEVLVTVAPDVAAKCDDDEKDEEEAERVGEAATQKSGSGSTPAVITVAENADLHRERQPAIKVHGFHGESRHLFLSSLRIALFSFARLSALPSRRVSFHSESARELRCFSAGQRHVESIGYGHTTPPPPSPARQR